MGLESSVVLTAKRNELLVGWDVLVMGVWVSRDRSSKTYPVPWARATGLPKPESYLSRCKQSIGSRVAGHTRSRYPKRIGNPPIHKK